MAAMELVRGDERKIVEVIPQASGAVATWRASTPFPMELTASSWERLGWRPAVDDAPSLNAAV